MTPLMSVYGSSTEWRKLPSATRNGFAKFRATLISFVIYLLFTASPYQVRSSDASARQLTVGSRLIFNCILTPRPNAEVPSVRVATTLIMTPNSGSSSLPGQLAN